MRYESRIVSVSWIPSQAGVAHYDEPPPDVLNDLDDLRAGDRFRFANELRAWIEVEDGRVTGCAYSGGGRIGSTTLRMDGRSMAFAAVALPELQIAPEVDGTSAKFVQTVGGPTGVPTPRTVRRPPFVQIATPLAWTTLSLRLSVDGSVSGTLVGASPFPRHWVYDGTGRLIAKSGLIDFTTWYRSAFGRHSPWGEENSSALVSARETALERELSTQIMGGGTSDIRTLRPGRTLVPQGEPGDELFLLLDGVLVAEVDGQPRAEIGPGAILGERAVLEGGTRTATLRAVTPVKVAAVPGEAIAIRRSEGPR